MRPLLAFQKGNWGSSTYAHFSLQTGHSQGAEVSKVISYSKISLVCVRVVIVCCGVI